MYSLGQPGVGMLMCQTQGLKHSNNVEQIIYDLWTLGTGSFLDPGISNQNLKGAYSPC